MSCKNATNGIMDAYLPCSEFDLNRNIDVDNIVEVKPIDDTINSL